MATEMLSSVGYVPAFQSQDGFQILDQLHSNQIATMKEALMMANIILQLASMDASLKAYISAAENTPDLVQRLLLAQRAAKKESELAHDIETVAEEKISVDKISVEDVASQLRRSTSEKSSISSRATSRTATRSSVSRLTKRQITTR